MRPTPCVFRSRAWLGSGPPYGSLLGLRGFLRPRTSSRSSSWRSASSRRLLRLLGGRFFADVFDAAVLFAPEAAASFLAAGFAARASSQATSGGGLRGRPSSSAPAFLPRAASPASARAASWLRPAWCRRGCWLAAGSPDQVGRSPTAIDGLLRRVRMLGAGDDVEFLDLLATERFFGSMPRMAFSTAATGRVASRSAYRTPVMPPGYPECR